MMECRQVQQMVWAGDEPLPVQAHLASCAECGREARRFRELANALSGLRYEDAVVPDRLQPALLAGLARTPAQRAREVVAHPRFLRGAALGAAAATLAAVGVFAARRIARPGLAS